MITLNEEQYSWDYSPPEHDLLSQALFCKSSRYNGDEVWTVSFTGAGSQTGRTFSADRDRQVKRQEDRRQSHGTNTAEVNAITETSRYFIAFHHHHHLSQSFVLFPAFMAGFLIDDKAIYVFRLLPLLPPLFPRDFFLILLAIYVSSVCFHTLCLVSFSICIFFFSLFVFRCLVPSLHLCYFLPLSPLLHRSSSSFSLTSFFCSEHLSLSVSTLHHYYVIHFWLKFWAPFNLLSYFSFNSYHSH